MPSTPGRTVTLRSAESGLAAENVFLLVIGVFVVAGVACLALRDSNGTEQEAREFAGRVFQEVLVAQDPAYFAAHLSPEGRYVYTDRQREILFYGLKFLGTPTAPLHFDGSFEFAEDEHGHFPRGHYEAVAIYPKAEAHVYLDITRHLGRWGIDSVMVTSQDRNQSAARSGL